ncbi:MAG: 7-cyano-7-deazaguanine synthase [Oscillatoria princeps RMCB-10]|jgi:7-cyano-7-deazaguanine synthase in queuosine biosynthesis|nr:7-cyano-7-deazaguanine synthase [Oscillatoria princeps RMCB-10]
MNHAPSIVHKLHDSAGSDYILHFGSVLDSNGFVQFIDCSQGKQLTVGINVDDLEFKYRVQAEFPATVADLVDLAVAIQASDRLAPHNLSEKPRRLHVVLPVRHPELLSAEPFRKKLENLLEWATGSEWVFDFQRRTEPGRPVEQQLVLPNIARSGSEVALWSGGLDALAGLYTRLRMYPEKQFVLFGTGSNNRTYARQQKVAQAVQSIFPRSCNLLRVPIRLSNSGEQTKNKIPRARGVVFTLLGAACAYLMGCRVLCVLENGIGAINLPYRASAVGLDLSRAAHPLTLLMVGDVVSELLGEKFRVRNPFLFWTKAEMCQALAEDGRTDLPPLTMSCDSPHRKQPIQCGYCSSCILRKQALAASKIEDKTRYVVPDGDCPAGDHNLHLSHMLAQVCTFRRLLSTSNEISLHWEEMTANFETLDDIIDRTAEAEGLSPAEMQSHLIRLYRNYVSEWDTVESRIAADFL